MISVRFGDKRGHSDLTGSTAVTRSRSATDCHDPQNMGFSHLRVIN